MRFIIVVATLVSALVSQVAAVGAPTNATDLRITVTSNDLEARSRFTLACAPPRGQHPRAARACAALEASEHPLGRPRAAGTLCGAQVYGAATALITGRLEGRRIWMRFGLTDGCAQTRWKMWSVVVPGYPLRRT